MEKEMITTKFQGLKTKRICGKYFSHLKLILSWQRWQLWSNMIYTPTHTQVYLKAHESMAPVSTGSENSIQVIKKDLAKSLFQKALKVKVLVAQACLAVWDSINCSLPGSSVHGILQARILKWVAILFFRASSQLRDQTQVSCIAGRFFTVWAAREAFKLQIFLSCQKVGQFSFYDPAEALRFIL